MGQSELAILKSLRAFLVRKGDRVKVVRSGPDHGNLRRQLDERVLAFRVARNAAASAELQEETGSWLRAVRRATGVPVCVLAKRLGVKKYEVFRLEKSEGESRIVLANLKRVAAALGCELVYALVPMEGSLEELAEAEQAAREKARGMARREQAKYQEEVDGLLCLREATRRTLGKNLRKLGLRVR